MGDKGSDKGWYGVNEQWHKLRNQNARNYRRLIKKTNKSR